MAKQPAKKPNPPSPVAAPAAAPVPVPAPAPQPQVQPVVLQQQTTNGLAVTGFILAFFVPLLGLIFSIIGIVQAGHRNQKGKGLGIAGIIISILVGLLSLLFFFVVVISAAQFDWNYNQYLDTPSGVDAPF